MSATKKTIKSEKLSGQVLHKISSNLFKSLKFKTGSDFSATLTVGAYYASFHEDGPTVILPKNSPALTFKIGDEWRSAHMVVLPQRQFALPVLEDYWNTDKAEQIMDSIFQDALDKIFGVI
jgi:hypothetical protein